MSHVSAARQAADALQRLLFGVQSYPIHHATDEDYQPRRVLWNEAAALARAAGLDAPPALERAGLPVHDVYQWGTKPHERGYMPRVVGSPPSVMEAWLAEVEALAAAARGLAGTSARLVFDDATLTITLDGVGHRIEDPKAYEVFKAIAERDAPTINKTGIRKEVKGVNGQKTIPRLIADLPPALRQVVKCNTTGYWIVLP
jgi:hypothetical protein